MTSESIDQGDSNTLEQIAKRLHNTGSTMIGTGSWKSRGEQLLRDADALLAIAKARASGGQP